MENIKFNFKIDDMGFNDSLMDTMKMVSNGRQNWPNGSRKWHRPSKWTGEELRAIRAKNGVGRPPNK